MILRRKIYEELLKWKKETAGKKALMVEGARRIGKSTIVEDFAKREYKSYILIDFSRVNETIKQYFEDYLEDLDTFFLFISTTFNVRLYERDTLFIFDEVQRFPKARECIKHLVKDGRYDYIETGSLISIKENVKDILIPSEERTIRMYPLNFEEFCLAFDNDQLIEYIRTCFKDKKPLEEGMHKKAMLLFKQYMLVGGMPQSVIAFIESRKDMHTSDMEKRDILNLYRSDIMKIETVYRGKVLSIFDQIPGLLSRHEKRIRFNSIEPGSYSDQYSDTFFWLEDSMICNMCFNSSDPNVGLSINEDRTFIKCYLGDTGLLISHAFDETTLANGNLYASLLNDNLGINEGMMYENVIAQMLVSNGHKLYFYTHYNSEKHRNDIEIDFILSDSNRVNPKIYPVEVKSSKRYTTVSLKRFIEKYHSRIGQAYVIHPKNYRKDGDIEYLPPYMTICL